MWTQQSPINLRPTVAADAPANYLKILWPRSIDGFRHDGEHGVEVLFKVDPNAYLDLAGKRFHLKQFHFHHPSEHLREADMFAGELHIVHQNLEDLSFAVIGIFLAVDGGEGIKKEMAELCGPFHLAKKDPNTSIPIHPAFWLSGNPGRIFRYEGSLTTEPYTESVSWIVAHDPKIISTELFRAIFADHPQKARPIQPINRRYILDFAVENLFYAGEPSTD